MLVRVVLALWFVAACDPAPGPEPVRTQVALFASQPKANLDLLYVIDDSVGILDKQTSHKNAFPSLLAELTARSELPSLHLGVVSSDLGTLGADDTQPGPTIGLVGTGGCEGVGHNAVLQIGEPVQGLFISDVRNSDGTRTTNYTGSLADAFGASISLGAGGCGFAQPLEAMKRALDNHPVNSGFLRPDAALAIVVLTDEDDCSFTHSTLLGPESETLGPLRSFRCTRFGVQCAQGGITTQDMDEPGAKAGCHWREQSPYLTTKARYTEFLSALKPDPRDVLVAAIAGPPEPVIVQLRTPPGGGTSVSALAQSCAYSDVSEPAAAEPGVRIADLTRSLPRSRFEHICNTDQTPAAVAIAREIRGLLGDPCLTRDIASPADCEVYDEVPSGKRRFPACDSKITVDCYELVDDSACTTSQRLRVEVTRSAPAPADSMLAVRCVL